MTDFERNQNATCNATRVVVHLADASPYTTALLEAGSIVLADVNGTVVVKLSEVRYNVEVGICGLISTSASSSKDGLAGPGTRGGRPWMS